MTAKAETTFKHRTAVVLAFLFATALFATKQAQAQKPSTTGFPISISYYGDFYAHPGIKIGTEKLLLSKTNEKQKRKVLKMKTRSLLVTGFVRAYTHPGNHRALGLGSELVYRKTKSSGWKKEVLLGAGYQRRFNKGTTYTTDATGGVRNVPLASRGYFQPSLSFGIGKDLSVTMKAPFAWHLRTGFHLLAPFNSGTVMGLNAEAGIIYKL